MSDKLREALKSLLDGCVSFDPYQAILPQQMERARAALADTNGEWQTIKITGLSVLDDGRAEARFDWPKDWPMEIGRYRLAKEG